MRWSRISDPGGGFRLCHGSCRWTGVSQAYGKRPAGSPRRLRVGAEGSGPPSNGFHPGSRFASAGRAWISTADTPRGS